MGIFFSLGLAMLIDPSQGKRWILRALLIAAISYPSIIVTRLVYRSLEELTLWIRGQNERDGECERVLLYGAGARAQLFLKDRIIKITKRPDQRVIVGLMDDENALHFQWVYGYLVLGGINELPYLISKYQINRIIIIADLLSENRNLVSKICREEKIHLSEWFPMEHKIDLTAPCQSGIMETLEENI